MNNLTKLLFAMLWLALPSCLDYQRNVIATLEAEIETLTAESVPIKFVVDRRTTDSLQFRVKLLSATDEVITQREYCLKGHELSFDFYVIWLKESKRFLAFPYKIYTDQIAPDDGVLLYELYDKDGFPQVFDNQQLTTKMRQALSEVFASLSQQRESELKVYFGSMVHDLKNINQFKIGTVYKIVCRTRGGIEISEQ